MSQFRQPALARHSTSSRRVGMVRPEVRVRREDMELVRGVARALADPACEAETRAWLRERGCAPVDLKRLLAEAPLEGIDLARERDRGRPVEL